MRSHYAQPSAASVHDVIKFLLKTVILAAAFYGLTYFEVLPGLTVDANEQGPLGEYGTYLWIGLLFGVVNAIVGPILRLLSLPDALQWYADRLVRIGLQELFGLPQVARREDAVRALQQRRIVVRLVKKQRGHQ